MAHTRDDAIPELVPPNTELQRLRYHMRQIADVSSQETTAQADNSRSPANLCTLILHLPALAVQQVASGIDLNGPQTEAVSRWTLDGALFMNDPSSFPPDRKFTEIADGKSAVLRAYRNAGIQEVLLVAVCGGRGTVELPADRQVLRNVFAQYELAMMLRLLPILVQNPANQHWTEASAHVSCIISC